MRKSASRVERATIFCDIYSAAFLPRCNLVKDPLGMTLMHVMDSREIYSRSGLP